MFLARLSPPVLHVRRFLDSVNPALGDVNGSALTLRSFRMLCVLSGVLLPVFGWTYHASGRPVFDPLAIRYAISALALALLGLSYVSPAVQRQACRLHQSGVYAMTVYFGWLVYANDLSPDYALGFLFVFAVLALAHSLAYTERRPFVRYLLVSTAISLLTVALVPAPGVYPPLFVLSVGALAGTLYVAVVARMETYRLLLISQQQHTAAEALAGAGSWIMDVERGVTTWSEGARHLFGVPPGVVPPSMSTFVHPADRPEADAALARLLSTGGTAEVTFRGIALDGTERTLRSTSRAEAGDGSRPERLYGVLLDVTAQVEREAALRDARDRAQDAARAKSDFLANMSHEIRTPLTAIIGFAQILREETGSAYHDLVGPIESGGVRLLETLNSVLDIARMEAGHLDLALAPVDVAAEVHAAVELLAGRAAEKRLTLTADAPLGLPAVLANRPALNRILANLVSNAVKFTPAGHVRVTAREAAGRVEIRVADTGEGMSPDFLGSLYEPFQQASTGWARSHEGTGLGLTITRGLVEGMGGTIAVESAAGQGTTFTVSLPVAPAGAAEAPAESGVSPRARAAA